ncbi:MAG TPA: hypothetical protein VNS50_09140 [Ginsengibacter sp.]|nr:hypothetical protein [Ginsengibacter sp.]
MKNRSQDIQFINNLHQNFYPSSVGLPKTITLSLESHTPPLIELISYIYP